MFTGEIKQPGVLLDIDEKYYKLLYEQVFEIA